MRRVLNISKTLGLFCFSVSILTPLLASCNFGVLNASRDVSNKAKSKPESAPPPTPTSTKTSTPTAETYPWGVIGQPDLFTNLALRYSSSTVSGLSYDGTRFFAGDGSSRIIAWKKVPTPLSVPDFAVGQESIDTIDHWYGMFTSATSVNATQYMFSDATKLYVSDTSNNRVLLWNSVPNTSGQPADLVLGQNSMATSQSNMGAGPLATSLSSPKGLIKVGTKLIVADSGNNRVLIWNSIPTISMQAADVVLGQSNMTTSTCNAGGLGADTLCGPSSVFSDGTNLIVADTTNHRVLIFNTIPSSNKAAANFVIGQPDFISNTANNGGISKSRLNQPFSAKISSGKLVVLDNGNNRGLIWNSIPASNGAAADVVIGQPNGTTGTANTGAQSLATMNYPFDVTFAAGALFVSDYLNMRILKWNSIPTVDATPADAVIRQNNATSTTQYSHPFIGAYAGRPQNIALCNGKLLVTDYTFSRVYVWNSIPMSPTIAPDIVLGQMSMTEIRANAGNPAPSAGTFANQGHIACEGDKLIIADMYNHRVLIWNTFPTSNGQPADVVLGQPNFTSNTCNNGGLSASSMCLPSGALVVNGKLVIGDYNNKRVLIFNSIPTSNNQVANAVIGQPDFVSNVSNNGGIGPQSLTLPGALSTDGTRLIVVDTSNNRLLVWNSVPTSNQAPANLVLCQPNFTATTVGLSSTQCNGAGKVMFRNGKTLMADFYNNRILVWDQFPTTNGQAANSVLFQSDFSSRNTGISDRLIAAPGDAATTDSHLILSEYLNNRVLVIPWKYFGL